MSEVQLGTGDGQIDTLGVWCMKCSTGKFVKDKCTAYPPTGQANWIFRKGWCPLGNVGPTPPASFIPPITKKRVGQQKHA